MKFLHEKAESESVFKASGMALTTFLLSHSLLRTFFFPVRWLCEQAGRM